MVELLTRLADVAVSNGFVTAMAVVCLIQYGLHLHQRYRSHREACQLRDQLEALQTELLYASSDSARGAIEHRLLRNFVTERDLDVALRTLLQTYLANDAGGLAAYVLIGDSCVVRQSIGLSDAARGGLTIDGCLLQRLRNETAITLEGDELRRTHLWGSLQDSDRSRISQLHLVRAGDSGLVVDALLLSTALHPPKAAITRQRDLAARVLAGIAPHVRRALAIEEDHQELRITREILELRSIVDLEYHSPLEMLREFTKRLAVVTGFDQATVYTAANGSQQLDLLVRYTEQDQALDGEHWNECEKEYAQEPGVLDRFRRFDTRSGSRSQRRSPFGEIVTAPMIHRGRRVGLLCLSRAAYCPLASVEQNLINWAAEYLLETILRMADRVMVEERARRDALTGLANRHAFDAALLEQLQLSARDDSSCALIMFDLDHFKRINDELGHLAGDEALRTVSQVLRKTMLAQVSRRPPLIARYGGEELAVILPQTGLEDAARIAELLRERIAEEPIRFEDTVFHVTVSGGLAVAPEHGRSPRQLISAADESLYRAKRSGRDRIEQPTLLAEVVRSGEYVS